MTLMSLSLTNQAAHQVTSLVPNPARAPQQNQVANLPVHQHQIVMMQQQFHLSIPLLMLQQNLQVLDQAAPQLLSPVPGQALRRVLFPVQTQLILK
jgi:hypothetical protein